MAIGPSPLLDTMSKLARVAWPFIQKAAAEGLGVEQIVRALEASPLETFRRTDMLALARHALERELVKSDIRRWPKDVIFPVSRVRQSITKIVAPFSYTLKVRVADLETGRSRTILRQAHSQLMRPMETVAANFLAQAPAFEQYQGLELIEAEVVDVQQAGAEGVI